MAKKKSNGSGFLAWMPFVLGILVTPLVLWAASVMALSGSDALTILFPWAQVFRASVLQLPSDVAASTSQLMMYLQFPIYGLVIVWQRRRGSVVSLGAAVFLHALGMVLAIILTHMSNPSLRFY
ncbi:MAG TPA: hypothetical protein VMU92_06205 [Acidobacteriaceae bacterium]|nr:hypothetical protein [Acidobacteriaceae bacterium]